MPSQAASPRPRQPGPSGDPRGWVGAGALRGAGPGGSGRARHSRVDRDVASGLGQVRRVKCLHFVAWKLSSPVGGELGRVGALRVPVIAFASANYAHVKSPVPEARGSLSTH